jgi:hypothetical protein
MISFHTNIFLKDLKSVVYLFIVPYLFLTSPVIISAIQNSIFSFIDKK